MHKVFGEKQIAEYCDRQGAYLIPYQNGKVAVVKTSKGYFLLGGGLEYNETHQECISREILEEIGYTCCIKCHLCSAEMYTKHPTIGYSHPIQTYYIGHLLEKVSTPTDLDHQLCWIDLNQLIGNMFVQMQNWALEQLQNYLSRNHNETI